MLQGEPVRSGQQLPNLGLRVVELAKEAGIVVVPAGSTFPYGKDPDDRNIRIAPSFPLASEVSHAATGIALAARLAAGEKILSERGEAVASA